MIKKLKRLKCKICGKLVKNTALALYNHLHRHIKEELKGGEK